MDQAKRDFNENGLPLSMMVNDLLGELAPGENIGRRPKGLPSTGEHKSRHKREKARAKKKRARSSRARNRGRGRG